MGHLLCAHLTPDGYPLAGVDSDGMGVHPSVSPGICTDSRTPCQEGAGKWPAQPSAPFAGRQLSWGLTPEAPLHMCMSLLMSSEGRGKGRYREGHYREGRATERDVPRRGTCVTSPALALPLPGFPFSV